MDKEEFPTEKDLKQAQTDKKKKAKTGKHHVHHASEEELDQLKQELAAAKEASAEFEDKYLRQTAELQNAQARYNKERAQLIKYEAQSLAKDILPAVDNLERALQVQVDDEASKQLLKGVQMTFDSLVKAMSDQGITEIDAAGKPFDPTLHQAVQTVPAESDDQKDIVVQVLQKGYLYKDRTLRPAMVVVAQ